MKHEIWKPVVGYESLYEVSSLGRVRSMDRIDSKGVPRGGFVMKPSINCRSGYLDISLSSDGKRRRIKIHRLVAVAFHGSAPSGMQCRHLDGCKTNNAASNLAWGTVQENTEDRATHGTIARGEQNGGGRKLKQEQVEEIRRRLASGEIGARLAQEFGVSKGLVYSIKCGKCWRTK